jgi:hypothetical protein
VRLLETQRTSFLDVLQALAAYVVVPVALLYPVGFFSLFAQFMNYFSLDVYTAWYAASLVNRMVAIEQGFTILAFALVVSVVLSASIAYILLKHVKSRVPSPIDQELLKHVKSRVPSPFEQERSVWTKLKDALTLSRFERRLVLVFKLLIFSGVILAFYFFYSRIVAGGRLSLFVLRGRESTECNLEKARWHQLNLWPDSPIPALVFLIGWVVPVKFCKSVVG